MEYFKDILCISSKELIKEKNPLGLISQSNYDQYVNRKRIKVLRAGKGEGNYALIQFDTLPPKYQALAKERFGNPETESQKHEILKYIEHDSEAIDFFKKHKVGYDDNEKGLPEDVQLLYSNNAAVLNAIGKAWEDHVINSRSRNKRPLSGKFWNRAAIAVQNMPKEWLCDLPKTQKTLRRKFNKYLKFGYHEILDGKWGNQNTRIITDEVGEWLVTEWSARVPKVVVSIEQLHALYNQEADRVNREAGNVGW